MKALQMVLMVFLLAACQKPDISYPSFKKSRASPTVSATVAIPKPRHIVYIWFENKGYSQIIGSSSAPYINSLRAKGTLFTNAHGTTHPSYPNYISWFSGSNQGVTSNTCIDGTPKTATTLYNALAAVGTDMRWYSENLPAVGSTVCSADNGLYREKHNPTTIFSKVPPEKNRMFSSLDASLQDTTKMNALATPVMCVTPNMINDMHDGTVAQGDAWLKKHFEKFINWAMTHNTIVVIYYDEDNNQEGNRIPVIMAGEHVKRNAQVTGSYNHYSFTKLTSQLYGASTTWATNVNNAVAPTGWEY